MRIKLDENIPHSLVQLLSDQGHDVTTVSEQGLTGCRDDELWKECQSERRFLITQDLDFSDVRKFAPGYHQGILLVRLRDPGRRALALRIADIFRREPVETWKGCFVVASERKLRVRRPETRGS